MRIALLLLCASLLPAAVIYPQAPPNGNAFDIATNRLADDFSLASAGTLTAARFWYQAQVQTDLSLVTWALYLDAAGAVGALLHTGTASASTASDGAAFVAAFSLPGVTLAAGTYWMELHAGASLTDANSGLAVWWAATDDNATAFARYDAGGSLPGTPLGVTGFLQYAFELEGETVTAVPEPSTLSATLAALWLAVRRRRTRTG